MSETDTGTQITQVGTVGVPVTDHAALLARVRDPDGNRFPLVQRPRDR